MIESDLKKDELSLRELLFLILDKKFFIVGLTSIVFLISIIYASLLPNIYTSSSILAPASEEDSLSSSIANYSGLAGLAGINLPAEPVSNTQEAIQRIQSFDFFKNYFLPNINLEDLLAVESWNYENNEVIYDDKIYDSSSKKWIRNVSHPKKIIPSQQEAYIDGYLNLLNISLDKDTGFISISIRHHSPEIAKNWLEIIIYNINESMRNIDKRNAENSINFLNDLAKSTNIQSLKEVISNLLESQMQTLMLASSSEAYVLKIIDSPTAPERKSEPSRVFIIFFGFLIGFILSILIVLIINMLNIRKSNKVY